MESLTVFDGWLRERVLASRPGWIADLGTGSEGKIGGILRSCAPTARLWGLEADKDHAEAVGKLGVYDTVAVKSAQDLARGDGWLGLPKQFDIVVSGDMIEHLAHSVALDLVHFLLDRTRELILIWPTGYVQPGTWKDPFGAHRCCLELQDLTRFDVREYRKIREPGGLTGVSMHAVLLHGTDWQVEE